MRFLITATRWWAQQGSNLWPLAWLRRGAETALERALDLAEPDGQLTPFLLFPAAGLLQRHTRHRTAHGSLIAEIQALLAGKQPVPPPP